MSIHSSSSSSLSLDKPSTSSSMSSGGPESEPILPKMVRWASPPVSRVVVTPTLYPAPKQGNGNTRDLYRKLREDYILEGRRGMKKTIGRKKPKVIEEAEIKQEALHTPALSQFINFLQVVFYYLFQLTRSINIKAVVEIFTLPVLPKGPFAIPGTYLEEEKIDTGRQQSIIRSFIRIQQNYISTIRIYGEMVTLNFSSMIGKYPQEKQLELKATEVEDRFSHLWNLVISIESSVLDKYNQEDFEEFCNMMNYWTTDVRDIYMYLNGCQAIFNDFYLELSQQPGIDFLVLEIFRYELMQIKEHPSQVQAMLEKLQTTFKNPSELWKQISTQSNVILELSSQFHMDQSVLTSVVEELISEENQISDETQRKWSATNTLRPSTGAFCHSPDSKRTTSSSKNPPSDYYRTWPTTSGEPFSIETVWQSDIKDPWIFHKNQNTFDESNPWDHGSFPISVESSCFVTMDDESRYVLAGSKSGIFMTVEGGYWKNMIPFKAMTVELLTFEDILVVRRDKIIDLYSIQKLINNYENNQTTTGQHMRLTKKAQFMSIGYLNDFQFIAYGKKKFSKSALSQGYQFCTATAFSSQNGGITLVECPEYFVAKQCNGVQYLNDLFIVNTTYDFLALRLENFAALEIPLLKGAPAFWNPLRSTSKPIGVFTLPNKENEYMFVYELFAVFVNAAMQFNSDKYVTFPNNLKSIFEKDGYFFCVYERKMEICKIDPYCKSVLIVKQVVNDPNLVVLDKENLIFRKRQTEIFQMKLKE
ncbi:TUS1 [[Candida] subhashii]|uniref:TUS1 n=1 Tax=[Candida] subhashii TaxID=561895 RepID=A0A8J5QGL0_9ASCO|nr:TUS1 [[Candida] subhashii]KAG7660773.1 TUS1 [[Candida] subhashii]